MYFKNKLKELKTKLDEIDKQINFYNELLEKSTSTERASSLYEIGLYSLLENKSFIEDHIISVEKILSGE